MSNINKINVGGAEFGIEAAGQYYGACSTAAATTKKEVTVDSAFALDTGATVKVLFANANTASAPTLQVNSTTETTIKGYGTTEPSSWWAAGDVVEFTYDGTNWIMSATQGQVSQINADLSDKATNLYLNGNILYLRNADNEILSNVTLPENNTPVKYKYEQRQTKSYLYYYTGYNSGGTAIVPTEQANYSVAGTETGLIRIVLDGYSGGDAGAIAVRRIQVSTSSTFSSYTTVNAGSEAFKFGYYQAAKTVYCRIPPT